ncbi:MAG: HYR domain-containing protein, partial [Bacteroidia bacterium]|nr:HYR domain-containing protein [Bacteroidia bacterium]
DTVFVNQNNFTCADVGFPNITVTAVDFQGNQITCTAMINIQDNFPPDMICKDDTVYLDDTGSAAVLATDFDNGSSDVCGIDTFTINIPSTLTCDHLGTSAVVLTGTDVNGNSSSCNANITVLDTIPPKPVCINDTICLNASGTASFTAEELLDANASSDNCAIDTSWLSIDSTDCSDAGDTIQVTVYAMDASGNVDSCIANLDIQDKQKVTAICKSKATVCLDNLGIPIINFSDFDSASFDNCGFTQLLGYGIDCSTDSTSVLLTIIGDDGSRDSCEVPTLVKDKLAPLAVCKDDTVCLDENGNASLTADQLAGGSTDNCGIASISASQTSFGCTDSRMITAFTTDTTLGSQSYTGLLSNDFSVVDPNGVLITQLGAFDHNLDGISDTIRVAIFDLNTSSMVAGTDVKISGSLDALTGNHRMRNIDPVLLPPGNYTVVASGFGPIDKNGNFNTGSPFADFEGGSSISLGANSRFSQTSFGVPISSVSPSGYFLAGTFTFKSTSIPVQLLVTDSSGNQDSCYSLVYVKDTIPLTITCPDSINVSNDTTLCSAIVTYNDAIAEDNCLASVEQTTGLASGSAFPVGRDTITYLATDSCGSTAECSFTVAVRDRETVTFECPNDTTLYVDAACQYSITYNFEKFDNCDTPTTSTFTYTGGTGVHPSTVGLGDSKGNLNSSCFWLITALDTIPPVISCPASDTVYAAADSCGFTVFDAHLSSSPNATDNCELDTLIQLSGLPSGSHFPVGSSTLVFEATDTSGNADTCSFNIVVRDTFPPEAICQDLTIYLDENGQATASASDVADSSSDNCPLSITFINDSSQLHYTCSDIGIDTVIVVVADSENSDSCTAHIIILDTIPPKAECMNIDLYLDENGQAVIDPTSIDNGSSDNCGVDSLIISKDSFDCEDIGMNDVDLIVVDRVVECSFIDSTMVIPFNFINNFSFDTTEGFNFQIPPLADSLTLDVYHRGDIDDLFLGTSLQISEKIQIYSGQTFIGKTNLGGQCSNAYTHTSFIIPTSLIPSINNNGFRLVPDENNDVNSGCNNSDAFMVLSFNCPLALYDTCTAKVTVHDTLAPIAVCKAPQTVYLGQQKVVKLPASFFNDGSSDNCGNISLAIDEFEFDCSEIGPNTVILTVTDDQGLIDTCSAIVNIMDLTKPTALCNTTVTAYADKNGDVQITAALIDNGSSDNCDIVSYTFDLNTLHCASNLVTMTVTDQSGNSASCAATVNVIDTLGPQAMCNDINLPLQPSGIEIITLADVNAGSWDGCGIQTMSLSQTIFSCSDQGTNIEHLPLPISMAILRFVNSKFL